VDERNDSKGAVNTAATSFASRRGISTSSTFGMSLVVSARVVLLVTRPDAAATAAVRLIAARLAFVLDDGSCEASASIQATHGRTPSPVAAKFIGN